jgi:8-oxo-dGTP pyrophosphatase MutT (NUDIX family)
MTLKAGVIMVSPDNTKLLIVINRGTMEPDNLKFGLPKGHIEKHESVLYCAMRELKEETGIRTSIFKTDKKIVVSETTYYLIKASRYLKPVPQDNTEIGESKWVTWDELMKTDCNRGLRLIRDKLKKKPSSLMKTLEELKPRKISLCNMKPRIKQYAKNLGDYATKCKPTKTSGWEHDCIDAELP